MRALAASAKTTRNNRIELIEAFSLLKETIGCPIEWLLNEVFQHSPKQLDHDYRIDVLT